MLWEFNLLANHIGATWPNGRGLLWGFVTQIRGEGGAKLAFPWRVHWQQQLKDLPWTSLLSLETRESAAKAAAA